MSPLAGSEPMTHPDRLRALLLAGAAAAVLAPLGACSGDARRNSRSARTQGDQSSNSDPGSSSSNAPSGSASEVSLTDQDLAPMDAYIRRRFWVLGDDVEIVASKEYFIQNLAINATTGFVKREDSEGADEARSVLTFLGSPNQVDFSSAPRINIGTGITITARRRIVIRFTRTTNPDLPVRLRIAANGKARAGVGNSVSRREENLVIGAQLRRGAGGVYQFEEQ
jgi:hypothetical protein